MSVSRISSLGLSSTYHSFHSGEAEGVQEKHTDSYPSDSLLGLGNISFWASSDQNPNGHTN